MVPTVDEIEEYLESLEELFLSSLSAATPDLPSVREAVNRLWVDVARYGPGMPAFPDVRLPNLGDFEVPPPPPPPPPPASWIESSVNWMASNPWKTSGLVIGAVGAGLLVGYSTVHVKSTKNKRLRATTNERRQVVVVLGGDTPLGLPLILDLELKGYIVIASVSTPEAVDGLELKCHGFVRALVLDPNEGSAVSVFLRSLSSTLSRRFPITLAGDPHVSPSSYPYIHSVISLLTLPSSTLPAPLEHISLRNTYLPYLSATHIVPLQVIQALLPLLRSTPTRSRDSVSNSSGKKSIIICLPAYDARIGLPFGSMRAMSAAATLLAADVLRREIAVAALTDQSESMRNIKVVVVDVGSFDIGTPNPHDLAPHDVYRAIEEWTPSEKVTYGPAFATICHNGGSPPVTFLQAIVSMIKGSRRQQYGIPRKPTDAAVFVNTLVSVVSGGRKGGSILYLGLGIGRLRDWLRGERLAVGAGARTYKFASHLPSLVLDTLLCIPYILVGLRNRLLPIQPFIAPNSLAPVPPPPATPSLQELPVTEPESESGNEVSEAGSEADVESNSGEGGSWINLKLQLDASQAGLNMGEF